MKNLLFALLMCYAATLRSQDTPAKLLLMNGKYLEIYNLNDSTTIDLRYTYDRNYYRREKMIKKWSAKSIHRPNCEASSNASQLPIVMVSGSKSRDEVFSIVEPTGEKRIFYYFDEPAGNYLEIPEMRAFVYGERDARGGENGKAWLIGGLVAGSAAGLALRNSIFSLAVPPVFALTAKIPTIRIKDRLIADKTFVGNENYAAGYESYTRSRNTLQALKGSAVGTLLGIIAFNIIETD